MSESETQRQIAENRRLVQEETDRMVREMARQRQEEARLAAEESWK